MCAFEQSISVINSKILAGEAQVVTEMELRRGMESGKDPISRGVDVITTAFRSSISGSAAMLLVPVAGRGVFTRAKKIWLNGVPGHPGPAPNERLGVVDTLVFADEVSDETSQGPCGAKLFFDVLSNREISVECLAAEGDTYRSSFTLSGLQFARMFTYNTFIPTSRINNGTDANTMNEHLRTIRTGNKVLLNRAPGIVIGRGTHGSSSRAALSLAADMFEMEPIALQDEARSGDMRSTYSVALTIPVLDESVLASVAMYLGRMKPDMDNRYFAESDEDTAKYLQDLVLNKQFLITDSDAQVLSE